MSKSLPMIKKCFSFFIIICLLSNIIVVQTNAFDHWDRIFVKEEVTADDVIEQLQYMLKPLDKENIGIEDIQGMIENLNTLDNRLYIAQSSFREHLDIYQNNDCEIIKWIRLFWLALGVRVVVSLLRYIVHLKIKPPMTIRGVFKAIRKLIRKFITAVIIAPIAAINVILTTVQYRGCQRS